MHLHLPLRTGLFYLLNYRGENGLTLAYNQLVELIRTFAQLGKADTAIAGGKGASLGEMTAAGIPVPEGFVVLAGAFEQFLHETDLAQEVDAILATVNKQEMHTVEHASEKIQALILAAPMPQDIAGEIKKSFEALGAAQVAVRSSATAEDSASAAWAGQLDSFLNTTGPEVLKNVQRCWSSLFTPRAIFYRFEKDMQLTKISVAVVVQKMVASESAGIAFSVHPVTEDPNQLVIEAGFGLGDKIVSGEVTPDSYVVEKEPRKVIDVNINQPSRVLNEAQINELSDLVIKIENHYDFPCDIEWAYTTGKFYILQSRPITTLGISRVATQAQPKEEDYLFMFEARGTTPIFEDFVSSFYMPSDSLTLVDNGTIRAYIAKKTVAYMGEEGLKRTPQEIREHIALLDGTIDSATKEFEQMLQTPLTKEKMLRAFELFADLCRQYKYFDSGFWEFAFKRAAGTPAHEGVALVQAYKNVAREKMNAVFFAGGYLNKLLDVLSVTHAVSRPDLEWYVRDEILALFDGKGTPQSTLDERKEAYVIHTQQAGCRMYAGRAAKDFFAAFYTPVTQAHGDLLVGETAHATGQTVRAKVRVINRDYTNLELVRAEMEDMEVGEVLVSQTTDPEMLPALKKASAAITDVGGMLSHTAITARELNIPCIVGVDNASKILRTGDLVEVDAQKGTVRIL